MRFILLILSSTLLINSCSTRDELKSQTSKKSIQNYFYELSRISLPKELSWCGEKVPLDIPEVKERAERDFLLLLQQPGQIMLYLKRSGRYFPMYERKLKAAGLPTDLKYLSVAESALYMARSSAGAVGLWQFMSGTGKKYGLRIDSYVDERKHPEKSTDAAIKLLNNLYEEHNSWTLAGAAYNMGNAGLKNNLQFQKTQDYFDLYLNSETSRYIFRISLIKYFLENYSELGIYLDENEFYKETPSKTIKVKSRINNLNEWAENKGCTYKDVKLLNPWILKRELNLPYNGYTYGIKIPE